MGASAHPHQLLAQGGEGLVLGQRRRQAHLSVRHRHRADLQLRRSGMQGEAIEDGEPQGRGLRRRRLLYQLLQGRPGKGRLQRRLSGGILQLLQQGVLTSGGSTWLLCPGSQVPFSCSRREMRTSRTRSRRWCCRAPVMPTASQKPKGYGIDMHHQGTDFGAGGLADRHGINGVGHRSYASPRRLLQGPRSGPA